MGNDLTFRTIDPLLLLILTFQELFSRLFLLSYEFFEVEEGDFESGSASLGGFLGLRGTLHIHNIILAHNRRQIRLRVEILVYEL